MCKETGREADYLPEGYRWDDLKSRIGRDQMQFYRNLLVQLGSDEKSWCRRYSIMSAPPLSNPNS